MDEPVWMDVQNMGHLHTPECLQSVSEIIKHNLLIWRGQSRSIEDEITLTQRNVV